MPEFIPEGYGLSIIILFVYFGAVMFVGLYAWRKFPQSSPENYILGGRGLGCNTRTGKRPDRRMESVQLPRIPRTRDELRWDSMAIRSALTSDAIFRISSSGRPVPIVPWAEGNSLRTSSIRP